MEANAPEKIYVHIKDKPFEITFSEVIEKECSNIEYTRTDAFIEKAERYIRSIADGLDRDDDVEAFINGFKKYMKK